MARMQAITPLVPVSDIDAAAQFFTDVLGFELRVRMEGYAYLARDDIAMRLLNAAPNTDMSDEARQQAVYIDVEDVDALYAHLSDKLDSLPEGRVRKPFDQDYGQREFHVIYEALLIFFGTAIKKG